MLQLLKSLKLSDTIKRARDAICVRLDQEVLRKSKLCCPVCLSEDFCKDGHGARKNRPPVQRFLCKNCGKKFCTSTFAPWYWHKYTPGSIVAALWKMHKGQSILSIRKEVSFSSDKTPAWLTLWRWMLKFGKWLIKAYNNQKPKVSRYRAWQTDEMFPFKKLEKIIMGTTDPQNKQAFLTVEDDRTKETMSRHLLRNASRWGAPRALWTDGHPSYPGAVANLQCDVPHGTVNHSKWEFKNKLGQNTNAIENVWRQLRRWWNQKNGLKKPEHLELHLGMFQTFYNKAFKDHNELITMLIEGAKTSKKC